MRRAETKYTEQIDAAAYQTPDQKIVVILLNKGKEILPVNLRIQGMAAEILIPANTLATCVIEK